MSTQNNNKQGISLHIGLNFIDPIHYQGWNGKLTACENDARDMQYIADSQGFSSTLLLREKATRKKVQQFIQAASKKAKKNDLVLITYSGHGGQVPDANQEEEDGKDETWCLYDAQLIDDELHALWANFAEGVRILVISDSCHSRSVIKSMVNTTSYSQYAKKNMTDEIALNAYIQNKDFYDSISLKKNKAKKIKATVQILSACQDNQFAYDGFLNSQFTEKLKIVWNGGKYKKDYTYFHSAISQMLPSYQSPGHLLIGKHQPTFKTQRPFQI